MIKKIIMEDLLNSKKEEIATAIRGLPLCPFIN
jgi:hypothetical protein